MMSEFPQVTDHAVLRYLERVYGIDVEAFRDELREIARPGFLRGCAYYETKELVISIRDGACVVSVRKRDRPEVMA